MQQLTLFDDIPTERDSASRDLSDLARLGKNPVLKRQFGFISMLGFACVVLSTWEGVLCLFSQGFVNGGPAGLVYGFILTATGTLSIFTTLSELASMAPVSAGQYHWCAMLAPREYKNLASYVTGWLTVCGWQAAVTSSSYLSGTMLQNLIMLNHPTYQPKTWQAMLLMWAGLLIAVFLNTIVSNFLPKIEGAILIFHVLGFFAILIPLTYLAPSQSSGTVVFTQFVNNGGWPSQGLSFWVGLNSTVFMFLGADSVIHMSEEIYDAARNVPRAIIWSILINGMLGFGLLLGTLFTLGDLERVLKTRYDYVFIQIFLDNTGSIGGATTMACILLCLTFFSTIGLVASSSRMTWAFARDRGLPGWRYLSKVESKRAIPVITILVTAIFAILLDLIDLGSSTVLNDLMSLSVNSMYGSYFISASLLLWRRCASDIVDDRRETCITANPIGLSWGPWRIPGILGIINNAFACVWMVVVLFFTSWPPATPVTASTMNYSIFVTFSVAIVSTIYYIVWARKSYHGPVVEIVQSIEMGAIEPLKIADIRTWTGHGRTRSQSFTCQTSETDVIGITSQ